MTRLLVAFLSIFLSAGVSLFAQESDEKVFGAKVTAVSGSSITVENLQTNKPETFSISAGAEILRDRKAAAATDIKVGELVRITVKGNTVVAIGLKARQ